MEPSAPFTLGRDRAAGPRERWGDLFLFAGTVLVLALLAALDVSLEPFPAAAAIVVVCGGAVALLLTRRAPLASSEPERTIGRILVPLACLLRLAYLVGWYSLAQARGLETVGSDAGMYLDWGRVISRHMPAFHDITTYSQAGTYDIGFHYFLGLALWALGGNLLAIHIVLAFLGAFTCFLLWQVSRPLVSEKAVWPAFLLAVSPLSVSIAGSDLMKDGLLTLFFLLALWGGQQIYARSGRSLAGAIALITGFASCRLIRSYVGLVLEAGLIGLPIAVTLFRRPRRTALSAIARPIALLVLLFAGTEAALTAARQPPLAKQILAMGMDVPNNDRLLSGPLGRVEQSAVSRVPRKSGAETPRAETFAADSSKIPAGLRERLRHHGFDIVRRLYGPFLWVPARANQVETFLIGNWASYLDSPLWYWAWPFGLCGAWFLIREKRWDGWFVAAVVLSFTVLLLVFQISYRQRGSNLVPLLLVAACVGWVKVGTRARRTVLILQGSVLAALAAAYWIVRASAVS
jgi:hypothetical protein